MKTKTLKTEILIIGAGIYGVSIANTLHHYGKKIFICGKYMDLWKHHTFPSMVLRSDFKLSEVYHPDGRYSTENFFKEFPEYSEYLAVHLPVFVFKKYLNWVEKKIPYDINNEMVTRLEYSKKNKCFQAALGSGKTIYAMKVVIATGLSCFLNFPENPDKTRILHSYFSSKIEKIKNKNVSVIGSGQSAAECIEILMANKNNINHVFKKKPVFLEQPVNIPSWLFRFIETSPAIFYRLPPIVKRIAMKFLSHPTVMPSHSHLLEKVTWKNNLDFQADIVVASTGFSYNIRQIPFLSEEIKEEIGKRDDYKFVDEFFESCFKGLYFAGPMTSTVFGPAVRFIVGAAYTARKISEKIRHLT